ncbi:hypothetical protein MUCCIDRAFT_71831 [Mucor lusitanicus CBS 277.49]|uniref:Uncharacterized protein n=1 Tax=Mucor lusitanicus CBS 277.49 TaxID=747725 RepID=A0A168PLI2_MUCCL|nr:hypothetical protein MUCCIDRAFT_71831 [Mucor lusitanicus CBS 277.49]
MRASTSKSSQAAYGATYYCNVKTSPIHNAASTSIQKQAILLPLLPAAQYNIKTDYYIQGQAMLPHLLLSLLYIQDLLSIRSPIHRSKHLLKTMNTIQPLSWYC